jgi:hypothetical protein
MTHRIGVALLVTASIAVCLPALGQQKSSKLPVHPAVDWSLSCVECHERETPAVTRDWLKGKHGEVNIGCFVCHGDGEVEFQPKPGGERCASCHASQEVNFAALPVKTCFFCHAGHTLKFHH